MNLEKSIGLAQLSRPPHEEKVEERLSARQVAQRVFKISAQAGAPFIGVTQEAWAKKWLDSEEFVLMEIPLNRVAVVGRPATNRILAMAQVADPEPIIVDLNKRKVGQTPKGYVPPVIVVDGQTRHQAQILRGREKVLAWVGVKAQKQVEDRRTQPRGKELAAAAAASASGTYIAGSTRMDAAMAMHAAMPMRPLPKQDSGDGGPQPTMRSNGYPLTTIDPDGTSFRKNRGAVERKTDDCDECEGPKTKVTSSAIESAGGGAGGGAAGGGGMGGPGATSSGNNPARKGIYSGKDDPSDQGQVEDPSDRKQSPTDQAPGAGVGPRMKPSKGGSRSDMSKILNSEGKKIDKIYEAKGKKKVKAGFGGPTHGGANPGRGFGGDPGGGRSTGGGLGRSAGPSGGNRMSQLSSKGKKKTKK